MIKIKPIKTKKRNRRHREPLGTRASRSAKKWGRVLAFTLPLPAIAFGAWWAYSQVTTSEYLAVKDITVIGAERVAPEEIVAASGIVQGQNLFSFSKDEVTSRLKANPWLESVEINREVPGSIEITVRERAAIAIVKLDALYVMDSKGVIFKKYSAEEGLDLPVVTGLSKESLALATENLEERLMELISVLTNRSGFNITNVSEINIDADHGLSLFTLDEGVRLEVGMGSFEEKLASFEKILSTRGGVLKGIEAFDLNNHREVVVRFTTDVVKEGGTGDGEKG